MLIKLLLVILFVGAGLVVLVKSTEMTMEEGKIRYVIFGSVSLTVFVLMALYIGDTV